MAAYLQKVKYAKPIIERLENKYPGIKDNPDLYNLMYTGIRAMPRGPQNAVKQNYINHLLATVVSKVKLKIVKAENYKEEGYDEVVFYTNAFE